MATPANSPCAPAMGESATPCMPVTSFSISCSSYMQARKPWPVRFRRERMAIEESRQHRELVARLRVVLHRARTERIEVRVDGEVELRQLGEVAHHFELADFRQHRAASCGAGFPECRRRSRSACALRRPLAEGAAPGTRVFEDDLFGMFEHCHVSSLAQAARTAALRVSASASA